MDRHQQPTADAVAGGASAPAAGTLEDRVRSMLLGSPSQNAALPSPTSGPPPEPVPQMYFGQMPPGFPMPMFTSSLAENTPPQHVSYPHPMAPFAMGPGQMQQFSTQSAPPLPPGFTPGPQPQAQVPPHYRPAPHLRKQSAPSQGGGRGSYAGAPPSPSTDHFPPLGAGQASPPLKVIQRGNGQPQPQRRHFQPLNEQQEKASGQRFPPPRQGQPRPDGRQLQIPLEQLHAEQATNLDGLARQTVEAAQPPAEETEMKRALLRKLGEICKVVGPEAELIPFGSFVSGFATASSDLDVVFKNGSNPVLPPPPPLPSPATLANTKNMPDGKQVAPVISTDVENVPDSDSAVPAHSPDRFVVPLQLEAAFKEAGFTAQLLTRTRVPIIKLSAPASDEQPMEIQCDIGFENHLALYNTELLRCYSACDQRVRQMVIFIKWWAKRRRINSPYRGTLSSYGYVLMILHYLINVVQPPVLYNLQNLQLFPVPRDAPQVELIHEAPGAEGSQKYEVWFYKAIDQLAPTANKDSLGELLRGWLEYYSFKFQWGQSVVSIRTAGGILTKQEKGWVAAVVRPGGNQEGETWEVKDRYLFALEDPFETKHNVARTCTGPGVWRIRDELRRAMQLLKTRDRGRNLRNWLCQELPPEPPFVRREDRDAKKPDGESAGGGGVEGTVPPTESKSDVSTAEKKQQTFSSTTPPRAVVPPPASVPEHAKRGGMSTGSRGQRGGQRTPRTRAREKQPQSQSQSQDQTPQIQQTPQTSPPAPNARGAQRPRRASAQAKTQAGTQAAAKPGEK